MKYGGQNEIFKEEAQHKNVDVKILNNSQNNDDDKNIYGGITCPPPFSHFFKILAATCCREGAMAPK